MKCVFAPRSLCPGVVIGVALLLGAGHTSAQQRFAVLSEPGTPVVATEILVATGGADEEAPQAGLAYLASRAVVWPILPVLDSLGAHLALRAQKDALSFTVIAAPDAWEEATRTLLVALFRDPVDSLATAHERRAIRTELIGREANPADALARETDAAVFGPEHPWSRSEVGYASTIGQLSVADVDRFLRGKLTPGRTVVSVAGPVDQDAAVQHLLPFFRSAGFVVPRAQPAQPADATVRKDYNSITTWVSVSYGFPAGTDVEALRMLADLVAQAISFGPTRRSIYDVQSDVRPRVGQGEVRFQMVVPPEEAESWAERVRDAVARFADETLSNAAFAEHLRHYRGTRLLELRSPEARAQTAARRLLLTGESGARTGLEELSAEGLRAAAQSLDPPVMVFLGSFLESDNKGGDERWDG